MPITQAEIVHNLRESAQVAREIDPDMSHRYELRADATEQGAPFNWTARSSAARARGAVSLGAPNT